jgi:hypothetical protein
MNGEEKDGLHDGLYLTIAKEIGWLVEKKQAAYGDSFGRSGEVLKILYPNGVQPEQYTDFLAIVRVIDKMFRIATDRDAFGEDPWRDIAGYSILSTAKERLNQKGKIT